MVTKRNLSYEKKFRAYLFSGSADRHDEVIRSIRAARGPLKKLKRRSK